MILRLIADTGGLTVVDAIKYIPSLGGGTVLGLVCWAWYSGKIVTRRELDKCYERSQQEIESMRDERNEWKTVALRSLHNNERVADSTKQVADVVGEVIKRGGNSQ